MPVFTSLCVSLDSGAIHNWKALVHHLHDYTMTDVLQLSIIEQRVSFVLNLVLHGAAIYSIDIL